MTSTPARWTPRIDRTVPTAAYHQVYTDLRRHIHEGAVAPGDRLPAISKIATMYSVSLQTAVRAVNTLAAQGFVVARHGSGVYVSESAGPGTCVLVFENPRADQSFFDQLREGLARGYGEDCRRRFDFSFLPPGRLPSAMEMRSWIGTKGVDGVVLYRPPPVLKAMLAVFRGRLPGVVLMSSPGESDLDAVRVDPSPALAEVLRRRLAAGRRRFAFLGQQNLMPDGDEGYNVYAALRRTFAEVVDEGGGEQQVMVDDDCAALAERARSLGAAYVFVTSDPGVGRSVLDAVGGDVITYTEFHRTVTEFADRMTLLYVGFDEIGQVAAEVLERRARESAALRRTVVVKARVVSAVGPGG